MEQSGAPTRTTILEIKNKDNIRKKEDNLTISKPSNIKRNKILKIKNSK